MSHTADITALLDTLTPRPRPTAPAPAPAPAAPAGSLLTFIPAAKPAAKPRPAKLPAPKPGTTKFPSRGLVFDKEKQSFEPEPLPTIDPSDIRRYLTERMESAPHVADAFATKKKPSHGDLRRELANFPSVTFQVGPTTYTVKDAWETYDLMRRNLTPQPWESAADGRSLRVCHERWQRRMQERSKQLLAKSA